MPRHRVEYILHLGVSLVLALIFLVGTDIFLDDAFIYIRTAEIFADTGFFTFNAGDQFNITTSSLWAFISALFAVMLDGGALLFAIELTFVLFLILAAERLFRLLNPFLGIYAIIAPFCVFFAPYMHTLSGHETALALFTGLGLIYAFINGSPALFLWAAMVFMARPEGAVFAGILLGIAIIRHLKHGSVMATISYYLRGALLGFVPILLWYGYQWFTIGDLFTATGNVKILQAAFGWPGFSESIFFHVGRWHLVAHWGAAGLLAIPIVIFGAYILTRYVWPLLLWALVHFAVNATLNVAYYHWYYYVIDFAIGTAFWVGLVCVFKLFFDRNGKRWHPVAQWVSVSSVCTIAAAIVSPIFPNGLFNAPSNPRFDGYSKISEKINELRRDIPTTLLTHEIGIFGHNLPKAKIYDVVGLTVPVQTGQDLWNWQKQIQTLKPEFLVMPHNTSKPYTFFDIDGIITVYRTIYQTRKRPVTLFQRVRQPGADPDLAELGVLQHMMAQTDGKLSANNLAWIGYGLALDVHAPIAFTLPVPENAFGMSLVYGYKDGAIEGDNLPDGIELVIENQDGVIISKRELNPVFIPEDRGMQTLFVPVRDIDRVTIRLDSRESVLWDWAYLGGPKFMDRAGFERAHSAHLERTKPGDLSCQHYPVNFKTIATGDGFVDVLDVSDTGILKIRGWSGKISDLRPSKSILITHNGIPIACLPLNRFRPDLAVIFGEEMYKAGFEHSISIPFTDVNRADIGVYGISADDEIQRLNE